MNIEYTQGETEHKSARKYMVGKQDGAEYLLIMLTYELGIETADELFWKTAKLTDAPFALAVIELSANECVKLDAEQIKKERGDRVEITSRYFAFGEDSSKLFSPEKTCPECILPTLGKSIGFGAAKYARNDKSYEKSDCAMMLLDELEADIVPVLINELELDEDVRVILGGHGMAGMFAVWAGHMSDSFFSIAAVSPAPVPEWWEDFSRGYSPLAKMMYVSYGSEELSARSNCALYKRLHFPIMARTHISYRNDRLFFQAQREGGHNDNVIGGQAEAFAWGMGFFGGLFIDGDTLVSYTPRKGVTRVVIPEGITKIASDAFKSCNELTEIVIPEGVKAVGDSAFYECRALKDITIPQSLTEIGGYAFSKTQWMKDRQEDFVIVNDVLIKYKGHDIIVYVPEGVRELASPAFKGRKTPEIIYLPESVKAYDYTSFWNCDNLREIRIPKPNPELKADKLFRDLPKFERLVIGEKEYIPHGSICYSEEELREKVEKERRFEQERKEQWDKLDKWEASYREECKKEAEKKARRIPVGDSGEYYQLFEDIDLEEEPPECTVEEYDAFLKFSVAVKRGSCLAEDIAELYKRLTMFRIINTKPRERDGQRLDDDAYFEYVAELLKNAKPFAFYETVGSREICASESGIIQRHTTDITVVYATIDSADIETVREAAEIISGFAKNHRIVCAVITTEGESCWHQPVEANVAKMFHPELDRIRMKDYEVVPGLFPGECYDRDGLFYGCRYAMWYGSDYGEYMDMGLLRSFDKCFGKEIYENGTVYIQMYDSPYSYARPEYVQNVAAFREHTKLDERIGFWDKRLDELEKEKGMFIEETLEGSFGHGGVKLKKTYIYENGEKIFKCNADMAHVEELDAEGNTVYEETMPVASAELIVSEQREKPYIEEVLAHVSWELPPLPCIRFSIKKGRTTQLSSKLGGLPYFPKSMELPKDSEGNTMRLLAQLNLEELPYLRDMPQKGILQFFISNAHDMFGMNEDDLTDQSDFRVIYHREVLDKSQLITEDDLPEYTNEYGDFPFEGEFRLVPNAPDVMQPTFFDHRMEEVFIECYNELSAEEITSAFDIGSDDYNNICERNGKIEAFTGGYPYFSQEDPRSNDYGLKDFDTVLFELNSISDEENGIEILFGDMGTATFLIPRGNLKKHDFSRVAYNYDCG